MTSAHAASALAKIRRALKKSADLKEIMRLHDQAVELLFRVRRSGWGPNLLNRAVEAKLRCERRMGQLLAKLRLCGGDRKSEHRLRSVTLDDLRISRTQSARWQREASLSEKEFVRYVEATTREGRGASSQGLLRLAQLHADAKTASNGKNPFIHLVGCLKDLARKKKRFAGIYADPPWSDGSKAEIARLPKRLCSLPVKLVAAPQAHLYLRIPPESLEAGLAVLRAWGFRYETMAVRRKPPTDRRNHGRSAQELLLLGVRGRFPVRDSRTFGWLDGQDKSSPSVHALIERASPPPYLDLFGAAVRKGWTVIGS